MKAGKSFERGKKTLKQEANRSLEKDKPWQETRRIDSKALITRQQEQGNKNKTIGTRQ